MRKKNDQGEKHKNKKYIQSITGAGDTIIIRRRTTQNCQKR